MQNLYAKVTDKSIYSGIHKVSNTNNNTVYLFINGEQVPFKEHEIDLFCDEKGNKQLSFPEQCIRDFNSINSIDMEFHMYEIVEKTANKLEVSFNNKFSDYQITVKFQMKLNIVEFKDGNDIVVENYSVVGVYKFIHLLRKHNLENLHKKFLRDGLINSLI